MHARLAVVPLTAALAALASLAALAASCATAQEPAVLCQTQDDCARGTICVAGACEEGCLGDGDCEAGFCVDRTCVLRPPEKCDCLPESACSQTAPECQSDRPDKPCITDAACDDGNPCSVDRCVEGGCVYGVAGDPRCCGSAGDCDDGDPCTEDRCDAWRCANARRSFCCTGDQDCDDGDPCTRDFCSAGVCDSDLPHPDCCAVDADCDDQEACTEDRCLTGLCVHPRTGVETACDCFGTGDCDDGNPCTLDRCIANRCDYLSSGGDGSGTGREIECCTGPATCRLSAEDAVTVCDWFVCVEETLAPCGVAADCDDSDACTVDACVGGFCDYAPVAAAACCNAVDDCAPPNACSLPSCDFNRCTFRPRLAEGCCAEVVECNDGLACTIDACVSFACVYEPAGPGCCVDQADCDDGNACTADVCGEDATCTHTVDADLCCVDNADCDDGNPCTDDRCAANVCSNVPLPACCAAAAECEDDDPCTTTGCVQNVCRISYVAGCCTTSAYCWDADPCTMDTCVEGSCVFPPIVDCCRADGDCGTADPCLVGRCVAGACTTEPRAGCCHADGDCDDGDDICTEDRCVDNVCVYASTGIPGCCLVASDCAAVDPCVVGTCRADGECSFESIAGCCRDDAGCDDGDYCTDDRCTGDRRCDHVFNGAEGCCSPFEYQVGWDGADHGWTFDNAWPDVGWQTDAHRTYAGAGSLYYGDPPWYNYDGSPPAVNRGTATSPPLALPAGQAYRLRLYALVDVRRDPAVDRFELRVLEPDQGDRSTVLWTRDALSAVGGTTGGVFLPIVVRLDVFAGRTIRLQVAFDSVTLPASEAAGLEGVYLDALNVDAVCPR